MSGKQRRKPGRFRPAMVVAVALAVVAAIALGAAAWLAWSPLRKVAREQVFAIPKGTWARRMAGDKVEILPPAIYLTMGVQDILVLKNLDDVPQQFGPILMMPGQSFRLPFVRAASYQFNCTAHASGQMTIEVEPEPSAPWARLRWRVSSILRSGQWV